MAPGLAGDQHAARLAINPVGEFRDDVPLRVLEVAISQVQRVDERIVPVSSDRMHDDVGPLVEDHEQVILIQDLQRNLGDSLRSVGLRRKRDANLLPRLHTIRLTHAHTVGGNLARPDQLLHLLARAPLELSLQKPIEPHAPLRRVHDERLRLRRHDQPVRRRPRRPERSFAACRP